MKIVIAGSRYFGAELLKQMLAAGEAVLGVVAPSAKDRLAIEAAATGIKSVLLDGRKTISGDDIPDGAELIVAAHCHQRILPCAIAKSRAGAIGFHPSLLPLYKGKNAIQDALNEGQKVLGGSVYHLTDTLDDGPVLYQDWCIVQPGDTALDIWSRDLCPMGLELLDKAVAHIGSMSREPRTYDPAR